MKACGIIFLTTTMCSGLERTGRWVKSSYCIEGYYFSEKTFQNPVPEQIYIRKVFLGTVGKTYKIYPHLEGLNLFYNLLQDNESKNLLVKLVAFRMLGHRKVRLPLSTPAYWKGIDELENLLDKKEKYAGMNLLDLRTKQIEVSLYYIPKGAYATFVVEQYKYFSPSKTIRAKAGDVVLDGGGCYGDTALYFAAKVCGKESGKVFPFEFIPSNLDVLKKNSSMNPDLPRFITVAENPLWEESGKQVFYKEAGSSSQVQFQEFEDQDGETTTVSIDDFVARNNLSKVDFIKMDIEGAEPVALKGGINTIKKFKPKLALHLSQHG